MLFTHTTMIIIVTIIQCKSSNDDKEESCQNIRCLFNFQYTTCFQVVAYHPPLTNNRYDIIMNAHISLIHY